MSTKSNSKSITTAIIVGLVALCAFLGFKFNQLSTENNQKFEQITELQKFQAELDGEYQVALSSLENMKNDNQELNSLIESQKLELKSQKSKINDLIWTKRELDKAKTELGNLNNLTNQYLAEINTIKRENAQLLAANTELNQANGVLTTSLQEEKAMTSELEQTKTRLMSENQTLNTNNSMLEEKVNIGSAIKLDDITFQAGSINDDGSFRKRVMKKRMDVFQTCFITRTNLVTDAGEEVFNVRILNENGETLSNEEHILVNKLTGEEIKYTTSGKMQYNNEEAKACINFDPPADIQKGNYSVEVYNKGFKVGTGSFKI